MTTAQKPFNLSLAEKLIASGRHKLPEFMQADAVAEIKRLRLANAELIEIVETFLGYDDTLIISVGGNPNVIEQMLSNAHAVLEKCRGAA